VLLGCNSLLPDRRLDGVSSTLISVQLRVGTTASVGVQAVAEIGTVVGEFFRDYTLIEAKGAFKGEPEDSAIVELFLPADGLGPQTAYEWCENVNKLVRALLHKLAQRQIIAFVTVSSRGREVSWSRAVSSDGEIQNPPFPWPALVVTHIVSGEKRGLGDLYSAVVRHFDRLQVKGPQGKDFPGLPAVGFRAPLGKTLTFGGSIEVSRTGSRFDVPAFREWDEGIISVLPSDQPKKVDSDRCAEMAAFLSLFRSVKSNPSYYVTDLRNLRTQSSFCPLPVEVCTYNLGIGSCEAYFWDTVAAWFDAGRIEGQAQEFLRTQRYLEKLDSLPYPLLGISVVTITPDKKVLIKKRGESVGAYPGSFHVVPSGIVGPVRGFSRPSVALSFLRELDEEMFGAKDDEESFQALVSKEHIKGLLGRLEFLGYALDLIHGDVNVLLGFWPDQDWWNIYEKAVILNWEYIGSSPDYWCLSKAVSNAKQGPGAFVPSAAVALNFLGDQWAHDT
jgi:hypothetical protein